VLALNERLTWEIWVKDEETLVALAELGVDMAQGYHTGRPGPLEDALTRLGSSGAAYSNT
jgi:EAL domain-containing protein (putative c-di-GMP-specific phosphodiesterase class I)